MVNIVQALWNKFSPTHTHAQNLYFQGAAALLNSMIRILQMQEWNMLPSDPSADPLEGSKVSTLRKVRSSYPIAQFSNIIESIQQLWGERTRRYSASNLECITGSVFYALSVLFNHRMMTMVQKSTNPTATQPRLSLAKKFDIIPAIFSILSAGFFSLFSGLSRGEKGAPTFFLHVAYAVLRKATRRFSISQFQ